MTGGYFNVIHKDNFWTLKVDLQVLVHAVTLFESRLLETIADVIKRVHSRRVIRKEKECKFWSAPTF